MNEKVLLKPLQSDLNEVETLPPFLRKLLLREICRCMDITRYCTMELGLYLAGEMRDFYSGFCPYCWKKNAYLLHKKTGLFVCRACRKKSDFIAFLGERKGYDTSQALSFLNDYLEEAEKNQVTYTFNTYNRNSTKSKYSGGAI